MKQLLLVCITSAVLCAACTTALEVRPGYRLRTFDRKGTSAPYPLENDVPREVVPIENLTLEDARALALANNHTVAAAAAAVEAARARIGEARAAFLPTLTGTIQRTTNRKVRTVTIPGGGSFDLSPTNITTGSAQLNLSLFAFGRDKANLDASRAELGAEILNERVVKQQLLTEVATAWYQVHNAASQVQVKEDAESAARRQLEDAQNIYDAGRASKDQVLIAKSNYLASKQESLVARNALVQARRVLNVLLARPADAPLEVAPPEEYHPVKLNAEELVAQAKIHNPALVAFRARRMALEKRRESLALSWSPEVFGALGAEYTDFRLASGFATNLTATIGVTMTPIDGGLRLSRLAEIHAQLAQLTQDELQALRETDLAIRKTLLDLAEAESQVELARASVEAAEESYRIISDRFRNGKSTSRDVLEAQVTLSSSRDAYNLGRFGHRVLLYVLESQVGLPLKEWLPE